MKAILVLATILAWGATAACNKAETPGAPPAGENAVAPAAAPADGKNAPMGASAQANAESACSHAACGDSFFVDAVPPEGCAVGAQCRLTLQLTALGDFHVNDEYPYKFKASDSPHVTFSGAEPGVFSKPAGDWTKTGEKSGAMAVTFTPSASGPSEISGTFKLSVCSAQNCLLEQRHVAARVAVR